MSVLHEMRDLLESDLQPSARGRVGLVVAGDLNHQPDSPLYELLQDGRLHTPSAIQGAHGAADIFNDSNGVVCCLISRCNSSKFRIQYSTNVQLYLRI